MDAGMSESPTDADRYPTLTDAGRRLLEFMREHEHAPTYRNRSGNRLTAEDLDALADHERGLGPPPGAGPVPAWVADHLDRVFATVPHYRALGTPPKRLAEVQKTQAPLTLDNNGIVSRVQNRYNSLRLDAGGARNGPRQRGTAGTRNGCHPHGMTLSNGILFFAGLARRSSLASVSCSFSKNVPSC